MNRTLNSVKKSPVSLWALYTYYTRARMRNSLYMKISNLEFAAILFTKLSVLFIVVGFTAINLHKQRVAMGGFIASWVCESIAIFLCVIILKTKYNGTVNF